jgi:ABC-type Zn uptake system ZnuABC Zn-binding protein ZnuA
VGLIGCSAIPAPSTDTRPHIAATTSIIGDVVARVGGHRISLIVMIGAGQDPHSYEPSASDIGQLEQADLIFANGFSFEQNLLPILDGLPDPARIIEVSAAVDPLPLSDQGPAGSDPHVWQNPNNVLLWVDAIEAALIKLDPDGRAIYQANADAYRAALKRLDQDIAAQVALIPAPRRKLITNHASLGYFARRYGFEVIGTVFTSGPSSEPTAGELAALIEILHQTGVPAIFVENTLSPGQAEVIAREAGFEVKVLTLYTDALGQPGSGADSYIGMMEANIKTIVEGLKP